MMRRRPHRPNVPGQRGFSLVELMVALAIMVLLVALAAPSFKDAALSSQLRSMANGVIGGVQLARSEAIKRNASITMCVSADGVTCTTGNWNQGWIVTTASGTNPPLLYQQSAPTGYHINNATGTLTFQPSGVGATSTTITVCRATPTVGAQERVVLVTATGRPSVQTTNNGACP